MTEQPLLLVEGPECKQGELMGLYSALSTKGRPTVPSLKAKAPQRINFAQAVETIETTGAVASTLRE